MHRAKQCSESRGRVWAVTASPRLARGLGCGLGNRLRRRRRSGFWGRAGRPIEYPALPRSLVAASVSASGHAYRVLVNADGLELRFVAREIEARAMPQVLTVLSSTMKSVFPQPETWWYIGSTLGVTTTSS